MSSRTAFLLLCLLASASADSCGLEIVDLLPDGIRLLDDINAGDTAKISADIKATLPRLAQVSSVCTGTKPNSKCAGEVEALEAPYLVVAQDVTVQNIPKLQKDIAAVVPQTNQAVKDCSGLTITSECSQNLLELIEPASLIVKDVKAGDYNDLEKAISSFLPSARTAVGICTGHPVGDSCQNDIDGLVPVINAVVSDFAKGNIGNLVNDLTQIITAINKLSSDCFGHPITISCETDLGGLIPVALKVFSDIQAHNYDQLQKDLTAAGPQIQKALDTCFQGNEVFSMEIEENEEVSSSDPCADKLELLVPFIQNLYNYYVLGNWGQIFQETLLAVVPVNIAIDVCLTFANPTLAAPAESACLQAFQTLVAEVEAVKEDLEAGRVKESIEELLQGLPEVEALFENCL